MFAMGICCSGEFLAVGRWNIQSSPFFGGVNLHDYLNMSNCYSAFSLLRSSYILMFVGEILNFDGEFSTFHASAQMLDR